VEEKASPEMIFFRNLLMKEKYLYSCCKDFPAYHKLMHGRCPVFLKPNYSRNLFFQKYTFIAFYK